MAKSRETESADTLDRWVGIGEASKLLGVRPATVRRWTAQGRMQAFVTPGGHRRYRLGDLLEFTDQKLRSESEAERVAEGVAALTVTDRREELITAREQTWFSLLNAEDRDEYRERGRETLLLIESYLSASDGGDDDIPALEEQGTLYGVKAAALGMSLRELITAFNLFRRPLISRIERVGDTESRQGMFERITDVFDLYMTAMVEAFLERTLRPITSPDRGDDKGGAGSE